MNKKIYGLAFGAIAMSFMASCNNDVKNSPETPNQDDALTMEVNKPDLAIWSGNGTFVGSRAESKGTTKYENEEVEINLALNDVHNLPTGEQKYDVADLVSHLSIHVRAASDVTVNLPVPEKYYCDQDDVYIYNERKVNGTLTSDATFKGQSNEVEYTFNWTVPGEGEEAGDLEQTATVKVEVTFNAAQEEETEGSITIKVTGVTEELLAYTRSEYSDGVNFDVYNYFNRANQYTDKEYAAYTVPELLQVLNNSEVTFVQNPDYYVNAFTGDKIESGAEKYNRDCWVVPSDADAFTGPTLGENGKNQVYRKVPPVNVY